MYSSKKVQPLEEYILRSALRGRDINVSKKIRHAIKLNDIGLAREQLENDVSTCVPLHCLQMYSFSPLTFSLVRATQHIPPAHI